MLNLSILFTLLITLVQPVVLFVKLEKHYGVILENITSSSTEIIIQPANKVCFNSTFLFVEIEASRDLIILPHMHQEHINGVLIWICQDCGHASKNKRNVLEHIESKHIEFGDDYLCNLCSKVCKTRKAMRRHYERCHPKN